MRHAPDIWERFIQYSPDLSTFFMRSIVYFFIYYFLLLHGILFPYLCVIFIAPWDPSNVNLFPITLREETTSQEVQRVVH